MGGWLAERVDRQILTFISHYGTHPGEDGEDSFNRLALYLFAYQYAYNTPYRMTCLRQNATPDSVRSWRNIPAAPLGSYRNGIFACFSPQRAKRMFESPDVYGGRRDRHFIDALDLFDASAMRNFSRCLLPDGADLAMRMLLPSPVETPHSSLSYLCSIVAEKYSNDPEWFVEAGRPRFDLLIDDLKEASKSGSPRLIIGHGSSFLRLFDMMSENRLSLKLAAGSRLMVSGGCYRGAVEVKNDEFLRLAKQSLGIPAPWVVNMYARTILSSQIYDDCLANAVAGKPPAPTIKIPPPWVRVAVIDPKTGNPADAGTPGHLRVWDLANRGSAVTVQTDDIAVPDGAGFRVIGRVKPYGSEPPVQTRTRE